MAALQLTMALERYERHAALMSGEVSIGDRAALKILEVGQGATLRDGSRRHERMFKEFEFDICEMSLSHYLMATERGFPLTAVPVFPRRLFSQGQIYVNAATGIVKPADLVGKKVAIIGFQVSLSVLARGDLKRVYGVPWEEVTWVAATEDSLPFTMKEGAVLERLPPGTGLGEALITGQVDALFTPHPPAEVQIAMASNPAKVRRLFSDPRSEELKYFQQYGYFPIMHVLCLKDELVASQPWLPQAVMEMYRQAMKIAVENWGDPNYSLLAWGRYAFEEEAAALAGTAWPDGVAANRANLEAFIGYSHDQNLITEPMPVESLFAGTVCET